MTKKIVIYLLINIIYYLISGGLRAISVMTVKREKNVFCEKHSKFVRELALYERIADDATPTHNNLRQSMCIEGL